MSLQSMTGFARVNHDCAGAVLVYEARSVNGRGADLRFRLPSGFDGLEASLRALANTKISRGNVQFSIAFEQKSEGRTLKINEDFLQLLVEQAQKLERDHGFAMASADGLLSIHGVVDVVERNVTLGGDDGLSPEQVTEGFSMLLDELVAMREAEGEKLKQIILGQIDAIEKLAATARHDPARSLEAIQARLKTQLELLFDANSNFDRERLYAEAAFLAAKADIQEEVDRLDAHVAAARQLLQAGGAIGRKLDFLAQEFNREANTLCSKANAASISTTGLALKNIVDQLREQVQNLE